MCIISIYRNDPDSGLSIFNRYTILFRHLFWKKNGIVISLVLINLSLLFLFFVCRYTAGLLCFFGRRSVCFFRLYKSIIYQFRITIFVLISSDITTINGCILLISGLISFGNGVIINQFTFRFFRNRIVILWFFQLHFFFLRIFFCFFRWSCLFFLSLCIFRWCRFILYVRIRLLTLVLFSRCGICYPGFLFSQSLWSGEICILLYILNGLFCLYKDRFCSL